jgi:hypothetical protein
MEEKWIRDPLSGILLSVAFIGYGLYIVLAAMGTAGPSVDSSSV